MTDSVLDLIAAYRRTTELAAAREAITGPTPALGGFPGASLAFFLAAWKDPTGPDGPGPAMVLTATQEEADEIQEELEAFASVPVLPFPAWESLFVPESAPDAGIYRQRIAALEALRPAAGSSTAAPLFLVAPVQAVLQPVPALARLEETVFRLRPGDVVAPNAAAETLARAGFRAVALVHAPGEMSARGDILDIYPFEAPSPIRVEFFGDAVESIREFQPETQRSIAAERREAAVYLLGREEVFRDCFRGKEVLIVDLLGERGRVFLKEPGLVRDRAEKVLRNRVGEGWDAAWTLFAERLARARTAEVLSIPIPAGEPGASLRFSSVERFRGREVAEVLSSVAAWLEAGHRVDIYCENPAEERRFREILADHRVGPGQEGRTLHIRAGSVRRGFEIIALDTLVLATREIFNRHAVRPNRRLRREAAPSRAIQSFLELERGDYVVHLAHGVGRFLGVESFKKSGILQEFLALEFRDGVKVYVPVSKIELVQKYIGSGDRMPVLDKVGGTSWTRKKEEVETALLDLASELIEIQALRREKPGFAFPADTEWQREFEAAFSFEETPDQVEVTAAIRGDMESRRPMDRLICGDVGYGKTELAMRAAFKAVNGGKQVAVLVPTTILAQQHFRTFSERMAEFPVSIGVLSRFRSPAEQKMTVEAAAAGKLDILIGTHRLLSGDVAFHDLGLVIIDEEQRFGVAHKERLKQLRSTVDLLTLTATPIPRTLHMSLLGIRDISSLTTAPEGRMPVKTEVCRFDPRLVREIILRELNRDGQVYFVHNRVHDIDAMKWHLEHAVPEARIDIAHGQMDEHALEEKMMRFFEREIDVLVATTIIESGLDIPNVNTIFIDEADRYGLADLHQLRGRVGRYKHQAYCYLLLPDHRRMNPDAQKRVQALVELAALGSGFQIAMRDLEIRGAGNILGAAQSGHITSVGYEMYCRLLERTVRRIKNEPVEEPVQVEVDLAVEAHVPDQYIAGESAKLDAYRRISLGATMEDVADAERELEDRFGPIPPPVASLLDVQRLRLLAATAGVEYIGRDERHLILKGKERMRQLLESCPRRVVILDPRTAAVPLVDPRRRYPQPVGDDEAFRVALEWMRTGVFPEGEPGAARNRAPTTTTTTTT